MSGYDEKTIDMDPEEGDVFGSLVLIPKEQQNVLTDTMMTDEWALFCQAVMEGLQTGDCPDPSQHPLAAIMAALTHAGSLIEMHFEPEDVPMAIEMASNALHAFTVNAVAGNVVKVDTRILDTTH